MHSLLKNIHSNDLPVDFSLQLFDCLVTPILLYCCEVWGHGDFKILEKLHLRFCKLILGDPEATPSYIVYGELGRQLLSCFVNARMIKFCGKIITSKYSKLCRILYNSIAPKIDEGNPNNRNRKFKWFRHIRKLLQELGYPGLWMTHDFHSIDWLYRSVQLRLKDNFLQDWAQLNGASSLKDYYLCIKTIFGLEEYLVKLSRNQRILIFRIRVSLLGIPVTLGRYDQTSYLLI